MAKVIPSSLITELRGSLNGSTFRTNRFGIHIYSKQKPPKSNSPAQASTRANFSYLSSAWYNLTSTQKSLWNSFASKVPKPTTGFNQFVELNSNKLNASYTGLSCGMNPPNSPNTPPPITGLFAQDAGNTSNDLFWITPDQSNVFCKCYVSKVFGSSLDWRRFTTSLSSNLSVNHNYNYQSGTIVQYRIRSILSDGRQGPYSYTPELIIPITLGITVDYLNNNIIRFYLKPLSRITEHSFLLSTGIDFQQAQNVYASSDKCLFVSENNHEFLLTDLPGLTPILHFTNSGKSIEDQLSFPAGGCADDDFVYLHSKFNYIFKINISSGNVVDFYTPEVTDDWNDFVGKTIDQDDDYIYATIDTGGNIKGILKILKSDMTLSTQIMNPAFANGAYYFPRGNCVAGDLLYTACDMNGKIVIHNKSDLSYVSEYDYPSICGEAYTKPLDVAFDGIYFYTLNNNGFGTINRIFRHDPNTFEVVGTFAPGQNSLDGADWLYELGISPLGI